MKTRLLTLRTTVVEILESRVAPAVLLIPESFGFTGGAAGHSSTMKIANGVALTTVDQADQLFAGTIAASFTGTDNGVSVVNYADADNDAGGGNFGANRNISAFGAIPAGDNNNYAIRTSGYLTINVPGTYTFGVNSDDGFRLKMGAAETVVVEATGVKSPSDVTGDVIFPTSGSYYYELTYFEGAAGSEVEFFGRGPSIPTNTLVGSGALAVAQGGSYAISNPVPFLVPDLAGHKVQVALANGGNILDLSQAAQTFTGSIGTRAGTGTVSVVNFRDFANTAVGGGFAGDVDFHAFSGLPGGDINNMALKAGGFLFFPTAGTWKFGINSDDGASLTIGFNKVINADGPRGGGNVVRSVSISQAGYYPYELLYFENGGGAQVEFFAQGPGDAAPVLVGNNAASGLAAFATAHHEFNGTEGPDEISLSSGFPGFVNASLNGNFLTLRADIPITVSGLGGNDRIDAFGTFQALTILGGAANDTIILSDLTSLGTGTVSGGDGTDTLDYGMWKSPVVANLSDRHAYAASMSSANEVPPPATSSASGNALLFVNPTTNAFELFSDVIGITPAQMTGSHLHNAATTVNGPVIVDLTSISPWAPIGTVGSLLDIDGAFPAAKVSELLAGKIYINIHTAAAPGGLIRGNFTLGGAANSATGTAGVSTIENVIGSGADDLIVGKNQGTFSGGAGNDIIVGSASNDLIDGGSGDDRIFPGLDTVSDIVRGGPGSDTLVERRIAGNATLTNTGYSVAGFSAANNPLDNVDRVILSGDAGSNNFDASGFTRGPVALVGAEIAKTSNTPGFLNISDAIVITGGPASGTAMSFTVSLANALFTPVEFSFKTVDGTAKSGSDYTETNGSAIIPAGVLTSTITISIEGNTPNEASEFFNVQISVAADQPAKTGDAIGRGVIYKPEFAIIDPKTATFRDPDGDIVTVKTTAGEFSAGLFNMRSAGLLGGQILDTLTLPGSFQGAKLSITAKRDPLVGGDGATQVGFINAAGVDLKSITISGDLATVFAGDGNAATPAIGALQIGSFGVATSFTQPSVYFNESKLTGGLGKLTVRGDFDSVNLSVSGGSSAGIGTISIGGSTRSAFSGGLISSDGDIGSISIKGSLRSTEIRTASGSKIGKISIGGDYTPGFSGGISSGLTIGAVSIKGDASGLSLSAAGGGAPGVPTIKSVTIGGNASNVFIFAGLTNGGTVITDAGAGIGTVKVGGDWIMGSILAGVRSDGFTFDTTLAPGIVSRIASITIGGSVSGALGMGADSYAFAAQQIASLSINKQKIALTKNAPDNFALTAIGDMRVIEFA